MAQQNGQQGNPPTAADLAQQKLQEQVQQAFALGWHMAELYNFDTVEVAAAGRQVKTGAPVPLAGAAHPAAGTAKTQSTGQEPAPAAPVASVTATATMPPPPAQPPKSLAEQ